MTEHSLAKISVVVPIRNEEGTILPLLKSFEKLSVYPSEIIIVDGGSKDNTVEITKEYIKASHTPYEVRLIETQEALPGKGRNIGIREAKNDIVACTDAGGFVDKDWIKELSESFQKEDPPEVVIGNCKPLAETLLHKSIFFINLIGLIKKDIIFSGAVSIAFRRKIWESAGGFPEGLYPCEDKYFLMKLKKMDARISFSDKAIVYWQPRRDLLKFGIQYFKYGRADGQINFVPGRYLFRFISYILWLICLSLFLKFPLLLFIFLALAFIIYPLPLILKCLPEIRHILVFIYIPAILLVKDIAQMSGYIFGIIDRLKTHYFRELAEGLR